MPNASNLHSNTVWKTRFSKLLSSLLWIVTVWGEKKKSTRKIENGGTNWMLHFYTDDVAFKSSRKKVRFTIGARASNSAAGWKFMLKDLSLSYAANCSQPCTKEWPPLFLTTSRIPFSSMLFTLHEFTRFLTSPLFRWEINPSIVGIALSENKKIMDGLKFLFSFLGFG